MRARFVIASASLSVAACLVLAQDPSTKFFKIPASLGHPLGSAFVDMPQPQALLAGFVISYDLFKNQKVISSLQPIFRAGPKRFVGAVHGERQGYASTIEARSGYAVGGLSGMGIISLNGFQLTFMKVVEGGGALDVKNCYKTDWLGGRWGGDAVKLGGDGKPIVGIFGRSDTIMRALGLIDPQSIVEPGVVEARLLNDATWAGAVNLMTLVSPSKDSVKGRWLWRDGKLVCADMVQPAKLQIPYVPPEEYDFRIVFSRTDGSDPVGQIFSQGGKAALWVMGHWGNSCFGFEMVRGRSANNNPLTVWTVRCLENNRVYSSVLQVRKTGVRAFLDGRLVNEWKTDFSDASMQTLCKLRDERCLGVLSDRSVAVFHKIDLIEVSGKGKPTRQPSRSLALVSP